ncbi:DUF4006 family protein [Evansella clarkii]|jgi:hypothetical protein|nr:DUF4006 family protein [Evansella clarkii]
MTNERRLFSLEGVSMVLILFLLLGAIFGLVAWAAMRKRK